MITTACEKDPVDPFELESQTSVDHAFAQSEFLLIQQGFDIEAQGNDIVKRTAGESSLFLPCATVSASANPDSTYTLELDFGTGTTCADNRTRSGKLTATLSGKWSTVGTSVTIVPTNYQVTTADGIPYTLDFTMTYTFEEILPSGNFVFRSMIENASLSSAIGSVQWQGEFRVEWIEGIGDGDFLSNVYSVTGGGSGTARTAREFAATTTTPLRLETDCGQVVSGVVSLTVPGLTARTIDFGDGTCDEDATLTIGGFIAALELL